MIAVQFVKSGGVVRLVQPEKQLVIVVIAVQ